MGSVTITCRMFQFFTLKTGAESASEVVYFYQVHCVMSQKTVFFKIKLFKNCYVFYNDFEHRIVSYHLCHEYHLVYVYSLCIEVKI